MRNTLLKNLLPSFMAAALAVALGTAQAQQVTTLLDFNSTWKYDSFGNDLGTAWRAIGYDDASWSSGAGLLGAETTPAVYAQYGTFQTSIPLGLSVVTYYFRTTFDFSGSTDAPELSLIASNVIDDGCAIYLNGVSVGNIRLPVNPSFTTFASEANPEGRVVALTIPTSTLRSGQNTIAVEVHQASVTSSDMVFGMKLVAVAPLPLVITSQPQSQTVAVGERAEFRVGVEGGPVTYRWQKDGVNLPSTSNSVVITSAQLANAGNYSVIMTNVLGAVTSSVARLTVTPNTEGPKVIQALIDNGFGSNSVNVTFNEVLNSASARAVSNYRLVPNANTNISIQIANVLYSSALGVLIQVSTNDSNWDPSGDYFLVLNNVADSRGNNIAPYTRVPVTVRIVVNLVRMSDTWNYYDLNFFDPRGIDIYTNTVSPWYDPDYIIDGYWQSGQGIFYFDPSGLGLPCNGGNYVTQISFQDAPTLFRSTFDVPDGYGTNAILRLHHVVDDGMIIYLNGREIYRYNMPASNVAVNHLSKAILPFDFAQCVMNVEVPVSNLKSGTNTIAAMVYQAADADFDISFGLAMDALFLRTPVMPIIEPDADELRLTQSYSHATRIMVVSWPTNFSGFSLYEKSDLNSEGPGTQVSAQSNPYTNAVPASGLRFYELRKP